MTEEQEHDTDLPALAHATFEKYQESGNGLYLLQAIQEYGLYRLPIPFDVRRALGEALRRYTEGKEEAWTLDKAFNVPSRKGLHQPTVFFKHRDAGNGYSTAYAVWKKVNELYTPGQKPSKANVFADVADMFNVSDSTVKNYFNEVDRVLSQDKKS